MENNQKLMMRWTRDYNYWNDDNHFCSRVNCTGIIYGYSVEEIIKKAENMIIADKGTCELHSAYEKYREAKNMVNFLYMIQNIFHMHLKILQLFLK